MPVTGFEPTTFRHEQQGRGRTIPCPKDASLKLIWSAMLKAIDRTESRTGTETELLIFKFKSRQVARFTIEIIAKLFSARKNAGSGVLTHNFQISIKGRWVERVGC